MTVGADQVRISYDGDGVTTAFAFPYKFFEQTDLIVYLVDDDDVGVLQDLGVAYTVDGQGGDTGGTVTFTTAPDADHTVLIINSPAIIQQNDYTNADDFPAESHEAALDRLTKIAQRHDDLLDRCLKTPDYASEDAPDVGDIGALVDQAVQAAASAEADAASADTDAATASTAATAAAASASAAASSASSASSSASAAVVAKITWRGAWSGVTAYVANDAVQDAGSSYICTTGHTNHQPPNASYWDVLAAKGTAGAGTGDVIAANNLSDLANAATARTNLGLGTMATATATDYLTKAGNLSGIANAATARSTLGLGTMAVEVATDYLPKSGNLAGLANAATSRSNLGLGTAAVLDVGTGASNIVQLDGSGRLPSVDGSQLTGVSAGQPIPTTADFAVGTFAPLMLKSGVSVNDGATTAGSNLFLMLSSTGGGASVLSVSTVAVSGTWRNISGRTVNGNSNAGFGYWVRTA